MRLFFFFLLFSLTHCGYNWGHGDRNLPGGHKTVFISMFENRSQSVGVEADFTRALIHQIERSGFSVVTNKNSAELILEGSILRVDTSGSGSIAQFSRPDHANPTATVEPFNASLFTYYSLVVAANIHAKRTRDDKVIWQTYLQNQKSYQGPILKKDGLRASNALYNQSAKKATIRVLAKEMMAEAFDRLTENF